MKLLFSISAALVATALQANTEGQNTRTYRATQITTTVAACNATRAAVEARFTQITGLKTLGSSCSENFEHSADLNLEYLSGDKDPTFVSTFTDSILSHGLYASKQECEAALPTQVATFEANTGLKALVAYCFMYYQQFNDTSYTLRVDSFGTAALNPFVITQQHSGSITPAEAGTQQAKLIGNLTALGATNPIVSIRSNGNSTFVVGLYYAKTKLPLTEFKLGFTKTEAECRATQQRFQSIIVKANGSIATASCFKIFSSKDVYEIFAFGSVPNNLVSKESELVFASAAECEAERPTIEQKWRDLLNRNVVGSICAFNDLPDGYKVKMRLFWMQ